MLDFLLPFALRSSHKRLPQCLTNFGKRALVWFLFRRGGYKRVPLDAPPGPGWTPTGERFVDPTSGETLDVWFHAGSGERAYVRAR
jgi:hypothetical protein